MSILVGARCGVSWRCRLSSGVTTTGPVVFDPVYVDFGLSTHVGMCRKNNEDSYLILPEDGLFAVADGMGGQGNGEVASRLAVEGMREYFETSRYQNPEEVHPSSVRTRNMHAWRLGCGIRYANERIRNTSINNPALRGMGTTVVAAYRVGDWVIVANAGDSRCYLVRAGCIHQLTNDHTLANQLESMGKQLSLEQEKLSRFKHVLVNSVGIRPSDEITVDITSFRWRLQDKVLLCSDGLTNEVTDEKILEIVSRRPRCEDACNEMVRMANYGGGRDNTTVVMMHFDDPSEVVAGSPEGREMEDTSDYD